MYADHIDDGLGEESHGQLTFQPKSVEIFDNDQDADNNSFKETVAVIAPTRDFTEYEITVGGQKISAKTSSIKPLDTGDSVQVTIQPDAVKCGILRNIAPLLVTNRHGKLKRYFYSCHRVPCNGKFLDVDRTLEFRTAIDYLQHDDIRRP